MNFTILAGAPTTPDNGVPNTPDHSSGVSFLNSQSLSSMLDTQLALGGLETPTDLLRRLKVLESKPKGRAFFYEGGRTPHRVLSYGSSFTVGQ